MSNASKIIRTTEIVMKDLADLRNRAEHVWDYNPDLAISANLTNPTVRELEDRISDAENGHYTITTQTGQAAIVAAIMAYVHTGQTLLLPDSVYGPVRLLAHNQLEPLGIKIVYYKPADLNDLQTKIDETAALIYLEIPGSLTFEMQDLKAIADLAKTHDIPTAIDNTWATPLGCNPLDHGIDMVIHSLSKLISGNSDVFAGSVTVNSENTYKLLKNTAVFLGHWLSPDDAARVMSGFDSLSDHRDSQFETAQKIVSMLKQRPEVDKVFAPFDKDFDGHDLWQRYCKGGCGLFSFSLKPEMGEEHLAVFFSSLANFDLSYGWGGKNNLAVPARGQRVLSEFPANLIRLYCCGDQANMLIDDIANALDRVKDVS